MMNTGMTTLASIANKAATMAESHHDAVVNARDLSFENLDSVLINGQQHPLTPHAQNLFANRLGIPPSYLRRCEPTLQADNLNAWLMRQEDKEFFIRFEGDTVRAAFTRRYTPLDNHEVLDRLFDLGMTPDTMVQAHIDADFMNVSVPNPSQTFSIAKNDSITPGISIANSEVGKSCLRISAFTLRLICTNGLIANAETSSASFRHISRKVMEELPVVLSEVALQAHRQKDQFQISLESPVSNPQETIDAFNHRFQLSSLEQKAVTWAKGFEDGKTMFSIVNGYTKASQFPNLPAESVYRLQQTGGEILSMVS